MPVRTTRSGGYRWGSRGKTYHGPGAYAAASRQGRAVFASGWRPKPNPITEGLMLALGALGLAAGAAVVYAVTKSATTPAQGLWNPNTPHVPSTPGVLPVGGAVLPPAGSILWQLPTPTPVQTPGSSSAPSPTPFLPQPQPSTPAPSKSCKSYVDCSMSTCSACVNGTCANPKSAANPNAPCVPVGSAQAGGWGAGSFNP